jgi:D-glycero-alpha-D-manno-heptose 1-phosphate guanylyltransferase
MTIKEAIILAGGFGTRLQTVVSEVPKPMAPVAGFPFLHYLIKQLEKQGIERIVLSLGYKADVVIQYFEQHPYPLEIVFQKEEAPLGTGGGIKYAMQLCHTDNILVLNGDTYFDIEFAELYELYLQKSAKAALALRFVEHANRYGQVQTNKIDTIISFEEKKLGVPISGQINGGTYILNKTYYIANTNTQFSIEKDFFEKHVSQGVLSAKVFDNYFIDIGIPEDYYKANEDFRTF